MSYWPEHRDRWAARDRHWAIALHRYAASPALVALLVQVSRLSDGVLWYALMLALPWLDPIDGRACALQMLAVGVLNLALYCGVKRLIGRPRPFVACPDIRACTRALDQFSFPSGQTLHAFAYAVLLCYHYPMLAPLAWSFAALVALSRVVLGLHYPGDVLAGALTGVVTGGSMLIVGAWLA